MREFSELCLGLSQQQEYYERVALGQERAGFKVSCQRLAERVQNGGLRQ